MGLWCGLLDKNVFNSSFHSDYDDLLEGWGMVHVPVFVLPFFPASPSPRNRSIQVANFLVAVTFVPCVSTFLRGAIASQHMWTAVRNVAQVSPLQW